MAPPPRRAQSRRLLFVGLVGFVFGLFAADGAGLLATAQIDLPIYDLLVTLVRRDDDGFHRAQHALANRCVFAERIADGGGLDVAVVGERQSERCLAERRGLAFARLLL